jgi:hypothetical protein
MTTIYNLRATTNVTFRLTCDFSSLAPIYDIGGSTIRMQARLTASSADPPIYEWCSTNSQGGRASFNAATGFCVFSAPEDDMARMPERLVHDCRLELAGGAVIPLFAGRLVFSPGVTRTGSVSVEDVSRALTDTVSVDGEAGHAPAPLPLSLSAVLANAQRLETAAQASASAASLAAAQAVSAVAASGSLISALIYG